MDTYYIQACRLVSSGPVWTHATHGHAGWLVQGLCGYMLHTGMQAGEFRAFVAHATHRHAG